MKLVFNLVGFALALSIGLIFRVEGIAAIPLLAFFLLVFPPVARRLWSVSSWHKSKPVCAALDQVARSFLADVGAPATPSNLNWAWLVFFFDVKFHLDHYSPRLAGRTFLRHKSDDLQYRPHNVPKASHDNGMYRAYDLVEEDMRSRRDYRRFPKFVAIALEIESNPALAHQSYTRRTDEAVQLILNILHS